MTNNILLHFLHSIGEPCKSIRAVCLYFFCKAVYLLILTYPIGEHIVVNPQLVPRDGFLPGILQTRDPSLRYRQVRLNTLEIQVVALSQLLQLPVVVLVLILPVAIEEEHAVLGPSGHRTDLDPFFIRHTRPGPTNTKYLGAEDRSIIPDKNSFRTKMQHFT